MKRRRYAFLVIVCALALPLLSWAGQTWTDADGDGLPDAGFGAYCEEDCNHLPIDLWVDSQSFQFTSFAIWAEWYYLHQYVSGSGAVAGWGDVKSLFQ